MDMRTIYEALLWLLVVPILLIVLSFIIAIGRIELWI